MKRISTINNLNLNLNLNLNPNLNNNKETTIDYLEYANQKQIT